jgi:hypothetical protein
MHSIILLVLADALFGVQADAHYDSECGVFHGIFLKCLIGQHIEDEAGLDWRNALLGMGEHLLVNYAEGVALPPNDPQPFEESHCLLDSAVGEVEVGLQSVVYHAQDVSRDVFSPVQIVNAVQLLVTDVRVDAEMAVSYQRLSPCTLQRRN